MSCQPYCDCNMCKWYPAERGRGQCQEERLAKLEAVAEAARALRSEWNCYDTDEDGRRWRIEQRLLDALAALDGKE